MNYPTPYGNSDSLALENMRLKSLIKDLKRDRRRSESRLEEIKWLAESALSASEASPARMFNGEPFPAYVTAQEILEVIG